MVGLLALLVTLLCPGPLGISVRADAQVEQPEIRLQGNVPLARLLDLASQRLGLRLTYDEAA